MSRASKRPFSHTFEACLLTQTNERVQGVPTDLFIVHIMGAEIDKIDHDSAYDITKKSANMGIVYME